MNEPGRSNTCPPHVFKPDKDGIDRCLLCFEKWTDLCWGGAGNTTPPRVGKSPSSARHGDGS